MPQPPLRSPSVRPRSRHRSDAVMPGPHSSAQQARHRSDSGFTLIELVIVSAILLLVSSALMSSFESVARREHVVTDRVTTMDDMRAMVAITSREVRQATAVSAASTASRLEFDSYLKAADSATTHVIYIATGTTLTRQQGSGPTVTVMKGLTTTSVFTYNDSTMVNVQVVGLKLSVRPSSSPDTILVLDTDLRLRNRSA